MSMKHMRYKIVAIAALFAGVLSAGAQESMNKSIEVTKAYVPTVHGATKLAFQPRIDDTVRLQPDIDYAIKPVACYTTFSSRQINPAKMNSSAVTSGNPGYVSFAMGYPFRTLFDLYINNRDIANRTIGGYVNHRGSYSKIASDLDIANEQLPSALSQYNAAGFFGSQSWDNLTLRGEVGYDNRVYHRYGAFVREEFLTDSLYYNNREEFNAGLTPKPKQSLVDYGKVFGTVSFGDDFSELSELNFGVSLNTAYSYDLHGSEMIDLGATARVAKMFGKHGFDVGVDYNSYYGVAKLADRGNQSVIVRPRYMYRAGIVRVAAGVDYGYRISKGFDDINRNYLFPHVDVVVDAFKGYIIPYAQASGDFIDGSFEALSRENPYITAGVTAPTGARISTEVGVSGSAMQCLSYKAYFNYTHLDNVLKTLTGGGSAPSWDAGLSLRYRHKDKFIAEFGAKVLGARDFYEIAGAESPIMRAEDVADNIYINRAPACVDLNIRLNLRILNSWWMYVQGGNLANSRLYTYNHYRSLGTNIMLGFRTSF